MRIINRLKRPLNVVFLHPNGSVYNSWILKPGQSTPEKIMTHDGPKRFSIREVRTKKGKK